jgi:filamentous hemagglutinin family protein
LKINGGEREGNNLFHSFEEFSISEGIEAVFENAPEIENIFTRITGKSASSINGILKTQGGANFFLVNRDGIVFGENAQLDVDGSFIATTADSVKFEDGAKFIADDAQEKPILTGSVPTGLQFEGNNGAIAINGRSNTNRITYGTSKASTLIENDANKISIKSKQILALIGGDLELNSAMVIADNGHIELGSVGLGTVSIKKTQGEITFGFSYENVNNYQDIKLNHLSLLDASGENNGAISLTGKNIAFQNNSVALIQNKGNSTLGDININAIESFSGSSLGVNALRTEALGTGKGSNINVAAKQIIAREGGGFGTATYNSAQGGNVKVNVLNSIDLLSSGIGSITYNAGKAGSVKLTTKKLKVTDGGQISSTTLGTGAGGEVDINADLIELIGIGRTGSAPTLLGTTTFNSGNTGNVCVNSSELRLEDGAFVSANSLADGKTGNVTINSSKLIKVVGKQGNFSSTLSSSVVVLSEDVRNRNQLPEEPKSFSGSLTLNSPLIAVQQGGEISVKNEATGNAGTLTINTDNLSLESFGKITAASAFGNGGSVNLNTNSLQIDKNSEITATAQNDGTEGKITINTNSLIAKK